MRWVIYILLALAAILLVRGVLPAQAEPPGWSQMQMGPPPQSHGHENFWINHSGYKSPIDGTHCCGKNDCFPIVVDHVKTTTMGYAIYLDDSGTVSEIVPYAETQQSEDENYWRCKRYDGTRRCFFAPLKAG